MRYILIFIVGILIALASASAFAQDEPTVPSPPSGFCATAPNGFLSVLEGDWSFKQGAGFATAVGVPFPMPLPSHAPVPMKLTYDPETGLANLSGMNSDNRRENMVMFPSLPENLPRVVQALNTAQQEGLFQIGPGCDWYSLPIMVGTNHYSLDSTRVTGIGDTPAAVSLLGDREFVVGIACISFPEDDEALDIVGYLLRRVDGIVKIHPVPESPDHCLRVTQSSGDMSMTIIVKFQSPNSGIGIVSFKGTSDGHTIKARAPITMTRR